MTTELPDHLRTERFETLWKAHVTMFTVAAPMDYAPLLANHLKVLALFDEWNAYLTLRRNIGSAIILLDSCELYAPLPESHISPQVDSGEETQ